MAVSLRLKVFKGEQLVATREFERDMIKIGRLSTAHLCLDDERASRIHAVLNVEADGRVFVVDMGSAEGTFLNGKRVGKARVQPGDEIRIGTTRLVWEPEAAAQASAAPPAAPAPARAAAAPAAPAARPSPAGPPPAPAPRSAARRQRQLAFAPRAFGSYRPTEPRPRRPAPADGPLALQARFYWGDALLAVTQLPQPAPLYVGATARSALKLEPDVLGSREHALVVPSGGAFALQIASGMRGEIVGGDGRRRPLAAGTHELSEPDFALVELGSVRAEIGFSPQAPRVTVPAARRIDFGFLNLFLVLAFVCGLFVISASTQSRADVVADDLSSHKLVVAKLLIHEAARPKRNALLEKLEKVQDPTPGERAEKHRGEEGRMGRKDAPFNKDNRSAPRAIDINAKDLVKHSGLLNVLGSGGGGLSTIFGQGGLGGDIKGALGNMFGSQIGDSGGFGGLGLKGTGPGGGGVGSTIGIGAVGTKGRGGGLGSYGMGVGTLARKKTVDPMIDDSGTLVQGSLDRELIRQVIRRNIGQIRYCYESELQVKPTLAGRVAVQFVIAPSGDVQSARIAEGTTLHDARVKECIAVRVRSWKFPSPKGGGSVIVTYPFVFKQSGE